MPEKPANYAFIDGSNLHHGLMEMGWEIDYKKFRIYLKEKHGVEKAFIFFGYISANTGLYKMLERCDYTLIFKPTFRTQDGSIKGNVDAELVLHAMIEYPNYNQAIIVTGDGDFACLVEYLCKQKKLKIVLGTCVKHSSFLLRQAAKGFMTFIDALKDKVIYETDEKKEGAPPEDET